MQLNGKGLPYGGGSSSSVSQQPSLQKFCQFKETLTYKKT